MLTVQLFGLPGFYLDGQPIKPARRKSRAVAYYLAAHTQPLKREHLLSVFWPDTPRTAAQQVLRTTLHGLRKAFGSAVLAEDEDVSLAAEVDAREFEARITGLPGDPAALTAALALYQGDFLADVSLPDAEAFEDWAAIERERYRRLAVRGLISLSKIHEEQRDYTAALESLDRALAIDPYQEDLQREAMRLHYLAGDRPGAIRRFLHLKELLDNEMGVPPMAETQAMYDAIITDTLQPPRSGPVDFGPGLPGAANRTPAGHLTPTALTRPSDSQVASLPFAGRQAELDALGQAVSARKLALIEGESGIGKTRLAEEFIRVSGALPLVGTARELEQFLPYQPIVEAQRSLLADPAWPNIQAGLQANLSPFWWGETARLLPELGAPAPGRQSGADESRLWEAIHQFLLALAHERQVMLLLDDLHWADASTLALFGYLIRQPACTNLGFLATTRPVEPRSPLSALIQTLTREGAVSRISLHPLAGHDIEAIARRLSPAYTYPLANWLAGTSEGNPYILAELVRHARESNLLQADGALNLTALSTSPVVPHTVYTLIQAHLAQLSDRARRVLETAVVAGREFEFDVVAHAAALSESAALDALDELLAAHLIRPAGDMRYTFDHSLTMEVARRELGEPRHRLLHRRVAEAMEGIYRDRLSTVAGVLASHFSAGNAPQRAARYAFMAGQQAVRLAAWREAIVFFEQALAGAGEEQRVAILMALGDAHFRAGESIQAADAFRRALDLAQTRGDRTAVDAARLQLAQSFLPLSRYSEAIALAQKVQSSGLPENALDAEFIWGTALSLEGADLVAAAEHLRQAIALCGERADPEVRSRLAFELGSVAAQQGDLPQAIAHYREALAAAAESDSALDRLILAHNNLAYHLHLLHDPEAAEHARLGMRLAQERGILWLQPYLYSTLGEIALAAGDLETAERNFSEGLAVAERHVIPERIAGLTANLGLVAIQRGQTARAIHRLSTALARADAAGTQHLAAQIRLWLAPLLPPAEARACLAQARMIAESGGRRLLLEQVARLEASLPPA